MPDVSRREFSIATTDGRYLAATAFAPRTGVRGSIVLHSALAIPRQFYRTFAEWFAGRGYGVLTYDYRGIGDSAPADLTASETTVSDWAERDMPAAILTARDTFDAGPPYVFGHSMGGQIMGLVGDRCELAGMVTFSAQSGYWRLQYPGHRWKTLVAMGVLFPTLTRAVGYLPWSALFGGEDIPKPAALQWTSWCLNENYLLGDDSIESRDNFDDFSASVLAYSFEDDVWGYRRAVDWMMAQYTAADVERVHLAPADAGFDRIGHFGFFRPDKRPLWRELANRLR